LTNCLFDRVLAGQLVWWENTFILTNCTFHGGSLWLTPTGSIVRDSAFDGTLFYVGSSGADPNNYDYNAFINSTNLLPIGGTNNVTVTNTFNWQSGLLGNYYLPSDSPLINAGDVSAAQIGLSYSPRRPIRCRKATR
jgi:hypothetical protein